jgi:hypothetical protein
VIRSAQVRTGALFAILLALPAAARANPDALVPTISPPDWQGVTGSATNIFARVDYEFEDDSSQLFREQVGAPGTNPAGPVPLHRDLAFSQQRHTITPRIDVGLLRDTWIYGALPIVVAQSRVLRYDSGVDAGTSSTIADGLVGAGGFDAHDPTTPPGGDVVFRGVGRHGLDQLHLGVGVAPMNQQRDPTKPTWKLGAEARVAVGRVMRFDPTAPAANTSVGYGVHELRLWTTFDRRIGWAEPWAEFFWQVPLAETSSSLFQNPGFGTSHTDKMQQAGVQFGLEATFVDTPDKNRISLDLGARAIAHFSGREYSEMWEVFAYAGNPATGGPLVLDADPTTAGPQPLAHPGITNLENFLETGAHAALRGELGTHVRFAVLGDAVWKTDHVITFADAGIDKNGDDLVNPGTSEVNPLHVDRIDLVGHRYHSVHGFTVIVGVQGQVLF